MARTPDSFVITRRTTLGAVAMEALRLELASSPSRKVVAWPALVRATRDLLRSQGFRLQKGDALTRDVQFLVERGLIRRMDVAGVGHYYLPEVQS